MLHFEIVLRNFEIGLVIAKLYSLLKPLQRSVIFLFISPHDSNIVSGTGGATSICTLVPIHRRGTVSSNTGSLIIEVTQVCLASAVTRFRSRKKEAECGFEVAFVRLFVCPYEKVIRLGFSKPHFAIR